MNAGEIYVKLGLDGKKFDQGLSDAKKRLALFAAEIAATIYLVDRFVEKSTNAATRLTNLGVAAGISAQKLKQYGLAAALSNAGISAEEASGQIASFAKNLYSLQNLGQGDAGIFNQLKYFGKEIEWGGKSVDQVLGEISEKIQGLDDQTAAMVLAAGGFSPEMLSFFRKSRQEIEQITKGLGRSDADFEQLVRVDKLIADIKANWSYLQDSIVLSISPELERFGELLKDIRERGFFKATKTLTGDAVKNVVSAGENAKYWIDMRHELERMGKTPSQVEDIIREMKRSQAPQQQTNTSQQTGDNGLGLNNWGNLRPVGGNGFRSFSSPQEGMNALVADLRAKIGGKSAAMAGKYGRDYVPTLQSLISTYAPPSENNTGNYIDFVSKKTGIPSNRPLNEGDIEGIVRAVVKMEGNKNISVNTTNHVHGADAENTARTLTTEMERALKNALATNNNGAR